MAEGKRNLSPRIANTVQQVQSDIINGVHPAHISYGSIDTLGKGRPPSLVGTGASIYLDRNHANSVVPDNRGYLTMAPEAVVLVKKKAFSSLRSSNDLRFMDKTEKMLLRATKALFAYKVQQIRAYESLTKFENYFSRTGTYSLNLLSSFMREASRIDISKLGYTEDEWVEKRINEWYLQERDVTMSADDGTTFTTTSDGDRIITNNLSQDLTIDMGSVDLRLSKITNLQYIKSLSVFAAKAIIDSKKALFRREYKGEDGVLAVEEEFADGINKKFKGAGNWDDFWADVGTVFGAMGGPEKYDAITQDIASILKRNAFSTDNQLTTWIVDPDSQENYILGPGTGVIEVALFNSFTTSTSYAAQPTSANFSLSYPYRLGTILEDDIEMAINEALEGTVGVFKEALSGGLGLNGMSGRMPPIDDAAGSSILSAAFELGGAGGIDGSLDMDYIRERLRVFYLGKSFINPPDPVHFYVRSNKMITYGSSEDEQSVEELDDSHMKLDEAILKAEYQLYTNQAISYNDYKSLRERQDSSLGMIHVFGGFIRSVSERFSQGAWELTLDCTDNMSWLEWSQFSIAPSLSDPKNILEDPLTPYTMIKDDLGQIVASERDLIHENKQLLQSGLLSYDTGLLAGQNAAEGNILQGQYSGVGSLNGKKVMQHADGFVYRWKTGIVTATAGFQAVDPTGSLASSASQHSQNYQVTVAPNVLNNLDVPNILSILVVGQPYNIETFIEQSYAAHNKRDRSSSLTPQDPLTGVVEAVRKQNEYFGNFHPYRTNSLSPEAAESIINNAGVRQTANNAVKKLRERKVILAKKIRALRKTSKAAASANGSSAAQSEILAGTLQAEVDSIDKAIDKQVLVGVAAARAINAADKIGVEIGLFGSSGLPLSNDADENQEINRAMMMVGAQRRIEDVRLNRDRNLLIISDQYDSADIRPFILAINNSKWNLFDANYSDVLSKCQAATNILNLEFFCNSQGHLEFRPPLWNKTPLSVLKAAIKSKRESGNSVMPNFITNLFQTRIESLRKEVYMLNVKIVMLALMMGRYPDSTLIPNMNKTGESSLGFFGVNTNSDEGGVSLNRKEYTWETGSLTEQNNSLFGEGLKITASFSESGQSLGGDTETILGDFDPVFQEQVGVTEDILTAISSGSGASGLRPPAQKYARPNNLNAIRDSFKRLYGRDPAKDLGIDLKLGFQDKDIIINGVNDGSEAVEKALETEQGLLTKLRKAISKRDSFVSMLKANESKVEQLNEIETFLQTGEESSYDLGQLGDMGDGRRLRFEDDDVDNAIKKTVDFLEAAATNIKNTIDVLTGDASEASVYDYLIADDTRNFLGYGSGRRFIISDEEILSMTFREDPPRFTRVDIEGSAPFVGQQLQSGTDSFYFWAGATDFDLWRQYGYKATKINLPFISDVESQGRPYAILELGLQKMGVNKANVTLAGNEFYQPGDTVYIPSKGLLYYVASVNHNFSYGQSFTTSLSLVYGHPPGGYIPGPLDVIGQELVGNMLEDPALIKRTSDSDDNYRTLKPDSTLVFPTGGADVAQLLSFSDNQVRFTNMMIDLMGSLSGTKYLLIRGFVADEADQDEADNVRKKMAVVKSLFRNPSQIAHNHAGALMSESQGILNAATGISSVFGGGSAPTTMTTAPLRLPNNAPVVPIKNEKIIEQVTYLKKSNENSSSSGEIRCVNRVLIGAVTADGRTVDNSAAGGVFPKGGPRQSSWVDFRDEIIGFNFGFGNNPSINVIEVGILDIPNSIMSSEVGGG